MKTAKATTLWVLCLSLALGAQGEFVTFSNRVYKLATATECTDQNYDDLKNTGSYLLSRRGANQGLLTLSMDVQLTHYASASGTCFRAHPVFIGCVQDVLSQLKTAKTRALVVRGYRLPAEVASSNAIEDLFAASGTAMTLMPESRDVNDLLGIAQAILRHCPAKMERIQRNIGVVMKSNTVHVFMGGPTDPPYLMVDGYTLLDTASFTAPALDAITEGLEMDKKFKSCSSFTQLTSGQMYPADATSAEDTVGEADVAITRDDTEDFKRLVQHMGHGVQFANSERSASWCGRPSRPPCIDCRYSAVDATLEKRCTARMVTPRMNDVLTLLQKLTRLTLQDSVLVTKAWDEDYDGHVADASSLHREGRALLVKPASGNTVHLATMTQLAICAKADFVQHNGDHLLIAVQKQQGVVVSQTIFPRTSLVRVEPPASKLHLVSLPDYFTESDLAGLPVFDSARREGLELAPYTKLGMFVSNQTRYLRLSPSVVECFSTLQDYFHKRQDLDGNVTLEVLRGYMPTPERDVTLTSTDHRFASPVLGLSFEMRANSNLSTQKVTLATLARLAVTQCTPVFQQVNSEIGVGLYHDRVYVDVRNTYKFWNPSGAFSPQVRSAAEFKVYMQRLFEAAVDKRLVDPDTPLEAAILAETPLRQSPAYRYVTPERILRRRQDTPEPTDCVVDTDTAFCQRSKPFRDQLVADWWVEAAKKHHYHDEAETKEAFERCFGDCGTCTTGSAYEAKLEHCGNFLHWSPFEMAPEGTSINLFPREMPEMRKCACQGGSNHCIEDSALFLLVVNLLEAKYRPDPTRSVSEEMYPQMENPSPVAELINQLYVIHHVGVAKIWVQDERDIAALRVTLEKLMLYNTHVTEVKFYVNETSSKDAVDNVLRSLILEWTTGGSPLYTREFVAPYTIHDMEQHCRITSKRSAQHHSQRDMLIQRINSEDDRLLRFDL